jgi:hypothetical protein
LQQYLESSSFSYSFGDTTISSQNDVGPNKVRRRSTKGIDTFSGSINLTLGQYSILYQFYDVTTNGGVDYFTLPHPITGATIEARFTSPPSIRSIGGGVFSVNLSLEAKP